MEHESDDDLIERSRQGDRQAFERLMTRYSTQLFHFAHRMTGSPGDAEELSRQAIAQAFDNIGTYRSDTLLANWLYRIVRNTYLDEMKRRKGRGE